MGLLGVPFCSLLPKSLRCLCGTTCRCDCNATCECEEPSGHALLPVNQKGSIFTYEAEMSFCSEMAQQLLVMSCPGLRFFDGISYDFG